MPRLQDAGSVEEQDKKYTRNLASDSLVMSLKPEEHELLVLVTLWI